MGSGLLDLGISVHVKLPKEIKAAAKLLPEFQHSLDTEVPAAIQSINRATDTLASYKKYVYYALIGGAIVAVLFAIKDR